jgi:uncharacterized protein (DUF927 family)
MYKNEFTTTELKAPAFHVSEAGVYAEGPRGPIRICSRLEIRASARSPQNDDWCQLVWFRDPDGHEHQCLIPMAMLAADGNEYRARLLKEGLEIEPGRIPRKFLHTYIQTANPPTRIRCVKNLGWHQDVFVLPDETIGTTGDEPVCFHRSTSVPHCLRVSGSVEEWQEMIGRFCSGNSRLMFPVGVAFAGPLLKLIGERGGGFHFRGTSSTGKTTALLVAGSVWGGGGVNGFIQTWHTTLNGLEVVAEVSNDGLLCLDELGQVDPKQAGEIAYSLANGFGKQRMKREAPAAWELLFLSSGETSLAEHISTARRVTRAGQEVRLCEVQADAGAGLGLFQCLHSFAHASDFARHLGEAARHYYGAPIRAFLKTLTENKHLALETVANLRQQFLDDHVPVGASGEVRRGASRFALAGAAGELATNWGLTGWQPNESMKAAACFTSWLTGRAAGGDDHPAVDQVRSFLKLHGASRFEALNTCAGAGIAPAFNPRSAGFRAANGAAYLIFPEVFSSEICRGFDPSAVARALAAHGYLEHERGRHTKQARLPGLGKTRIYWVRASILGKTNVITPQTGGDDGGGGDSDGKLFRRNGMPRFARVPNTGTAVGAGGDIALQSGPELAMELRLQECGISVKGGGKQTPVVPYVGTGEVSEHILASEAQQAAGLLNRCGVRPIESGLIIWEDQDGTAVRDAIRLLGMENWPIRIIDPACVPFGVPVGRLSDNRWRELWMQASAAREISVTGDLGTSAKDSSTNGGRN